MTYTALTAGLRALRPCIAADSPDLGECAPFAVSRDGSGIFHTSKQGTIVKLRVAVRPVAELAFRTLIDAEDRLSLPLPYGGLVKATWLHERKVGLRIFDVPEGMLPSSLKLGLEEAHETVLSCDWDVDSRTGLPQSQVVYATLLSTNPPTAIKFRSGLVMKCHIIVLDTPVLAPTIHRPELDGILSGEAVASLRPPATSYAGAAAGRALAPPPAPPAGPARAPQAPPLPLPLLFLLRRLCRRLELLLLQLLSPQCHRRWPRPRSPQWRRWRWWLGPPSPQWRWWLRVRNPHPRW